MRALPARPQSIIVPPTIILLHVRSCMCTCTILKISGIVTCTVIPRLLTCLASPLRVCPYFRWSKRSVVEVFGGRSVRWSKCSSHSAFVLPAFGIVGSDSNVVEKLLWKRKRFEIFFFFSAIVRGCSRRTRKVTIV